MNEFQTAFTGIFILGVGVADWSYVLKSSELPWEDRFVVNIPSCHQSLAVVMVLG